jgi:UDP-N-acetylglucosamine--N-acetylmuramyl-(pentapeptide) pyrophosphoryl-undecaprenol N-acetylglucosamine transferase
VTRYLLAGGGTAGHVNPLLAVADRLREEEPDAEILVLGTADGLESRLVPERGYELATVARVPFPRRPGRAALRFPAAFRGAVRDIRKLIAGRGIDIVVGFGGFVSGPAYVAAWREHVPIVVHEANTVPGFANRLGSRFTRYVGVAFAGTRLPHARVVGMPMKRELEVLEPRRHRVEALERFALDPARPVLLVTGGSLGARTINETVFESAAAVLDAGWSILHITGERSTLAESEFPGYRILAYCDRMDLAFSAADLAIARAGSATVSELTALGVPAVYVPLAVGNGEQRLNAKGAVEAGAAMIVDNADFTPEWMTAELVPLLHDRARIDGLAARATALGVRDGTARTVALVQEAVQATVDAGGRAS